MSVGAPPAQDAWPGSVKLTNDVAAASLPATFLERAGAGRVEWNIYRSSILSGSAP